jgi:hypothetical protein
MSGLVAIIDVQRRRLVSDDDFTPLVAAYEKIRGSVITDHVPAGPYARMAHLRSTTSNSATGAIANRLGVVSVGAPHTTDDSPVTCRTPASILDGQFAMMSYDSDADELRLLTDPFGMVPLYVAELNGRAYASTSSLTLALFLRLPADLLNVQEFLVSGYHFGSGTHWQGVQRLLPATCVTFSSGGRRDAAYWRPVVDRSIQGLSLAGAADLGIETGVAALKQRVTGPEKVWSDLTGGYDSRLLNLLADRAGVAICAETRDSTDDREVRTARRVAEVTGWPWTHVSLPTDWSSRVPNALDDALAWGDGNLEVLQLSRVLWAHERLGTAGTAPSLLSGGGGEHFQYTSWRTEFLNAGRSDRVNWDNYLSMRMIKPSDRSVLAGDPIPAVRDDFRSRMSLWVEPYSSELNTTQLDIMQALKQTGHYGAYRAASDGVLVTQLPYYYRRVFETACSIDFRHRNYHRVMRSMVNRLNPRVAALPTTRGGPAEPLRVTNVHRYGPYVQDLVRKSITKTSDKLFGRPLLLRRGSYSWQPEANGAVLQAMERRGVLPISQMRSIELYRPERLEAMLAAASRPDFAEHSMLGRILTVELALRAADVGLSH